MKKIILTVFTVCVCGLALLGCSSNSSEEKTLKTVLDLALTCPNEEIAPLIEQSVSYIGLVEQTDEQKASQQEAAKELDEYIKKTYGDYFTENGLTAFSEKYGLNYHSLAVFNNLTTSVSDVKIEKNKLEDRYDFEVTISYGLSGESQNTVSASGRAYFENGKIYSFVFDENGALDEALGSIK